MDEQRKHAILFFGNGASSGVSCNGLPAKDPIAKIMQAADAFASDAPQSDGMSLFILRVL